MQQKRMSKKDQMAFTKLLRAVVAEGLIDDVLLDDAHSDFIFSDLSEDALRHAMSIGVAEWADMSLDEGVNEEMTKRFIAGEPADYLIQEFGSDEPTVGKGPKFKDFRRFVRATKYNPDRTKDDYV